jgi:NADH-ubiquinone oxidoreductase chain 5
MTIIGSLTTFFAATTALVQTDLKRVIAYSTCSQLGYMITACGLSAYNASIFHLSNHAFFKALLFLSAGSVIHAMNNEQDMRKMGGLINLLPFTYSMIFIGSLALMGFPFLSGFYSKDVILETAYATYSISGHFAFWLGSLSAFFTSFYSIRLIFLTFLNEVNSSKIIIQGVHDAPILMALPMTLLSFFSIFIGYFTKDIFVGLGTPFWGNSLSISSSNYLTYIEIEFLPFYIKILPVIFSTFGTIFSIIYYNFFYNTFNILKNYTIIYYIYNFLNKKWYFDKMYNEFLIQNFISFGYNFTYKSQDRGFLETFGPRGLFLSINNFSKKLNKMQTGFAYHFSLFIFVAFFFIIFILFNSFLYFEIILILFIFLQNINKLDYFSQQFITKKTAFVFQNKKNFNKNFSTMNKRPTILLKSNSLFLTRKRFLPADTRAKIIKIMLQIGSKTNSHNLIYKTQNLTSKESHQAQKFLKEIVELLKTVPIDKGISSEVVVAGTSSTILTNIVSGLTIMSLVGGGIVFIIEGFELNQTYSQVECSSSSRNICANINSTDQSADIYENIFTQMYIDRLNTSRKFWYESIIGVRFLSANGIEEIVNYAQYIDNEIKKYSKIKLRSEDNRDKILKRLSIQKDHITKVNARIMNRITIVEAIEDKPSTVETIDRPSTVETIGSSIFKFIEDKPTILKAIADRPSTVETIDSSVFKAIEDRPSNVKAIEDSKPGT